MRGEIFQLGAVGVGLAIGLGVSIPLASGQAQTPTISANEIKEGMKGYGLTVFKGTEPEKFDVEVVGVLKNFRPSQELILVKTPHPRLNITKNVRGMSGSPIYFDGRLAGAYAYSWAAFQVEPVAGVTPIAPMLTEMRRPIPPGFWPLEPSGPLPSGSRLPEHRPVVQKKHALVTPSGFEGSPGEYDLVKHAEQMKARVATDPSRTFVPTATPLMVAGMGDKSMAFVRKMFAPLGLEPMQAGGGTSNDPAAPAHFVNGGTLGVQLVAGDVSFFGLGTVTHVEGTRLCGFGHPMMEAGTTALPSAIGKVHWIFASDQHSSKIGESVRALGALVQDRQSAVVVDETKTAPVFPFAVEVKGVVGAPKTQWKTTVSEERFMAPSLVAAVLGSVVEATTNERRDVTWNLKSKLKVQGFGVLEFEDFGVASGGMPDSGDFGGSRLVRAIGEIINNPWDHVRVESAESVLTVDYTRDVLRLRSVELLDPVVDAGQKARVRVHLFPLYGPEEVRTVDIKMPEELAGKDVDVEIVPGYEIIPEMASPESLADLVSNVVKKAAMPKGIVLQHKLSSGLAWHGHVAHRLPTFAVDALRPTNADMAPESFANFERAFFPMDKYIEGRDKVKIKVRPIIR